MPDVIEKAREAVHERAELPGMSLMEHLTELRSRLIHSSIALLVCFFVAYAFHEKLFGIITHPIDSLGFQLNYTHPTDPLNLSKTARAFIAGLLVHAREITAVTNQWVNSYKRLWGFGAPGSIVRTSASVSGAAGS